MLNKLMAKKSGNVLIIVLAVVMVTLLIIVAVLLFSGNNDTTEETSDDQVAASTSETSKEDAKQENKNEDGEEADKQETAEPNEEPAKQDDQQNTDQGTEEAKESPADLPKESPTVVLGELLDIVKGGTGDKGGSGGDKPKDLVGGIFDLGREILKTADDVVQEAIGLSAEEENELGKAVHKNVIKAHKVIESPAAQQRIQRLAKPFLEMRNRKGIDYTFTIIEDDSVNAFALPGGHVYVHTGLLNWVANDDELKSVLGHEIGHVDLKHCVESFTLTVRTAQLTGGVAEMPVSTLYHLYELQFREDEEFEADKYAYIRMRKLGHSKEAALSSDRHFIEYHKSLGLETSQQDADSLPERIGQEFDNHFRTHPPSEERLKRLEAIKIPGIDD